MTDRPDDPDLQGSSGEPPSGSQPQYGTPPPALPYGPQHPQQPPPQPSYGTPPPAYGQQPPQQPAYGAPPYGAPPYGTPQYGAPPYGAPPYAAPPYGAYQQESPEQRSVRGQAIAALVVNAIVLSFTCFMALPSIGGVITAGIALGRVSSDPDSARRLVRWSWGLLIGTIVLGALLIGGIIALGAAVDSPTTGTDTTGY